MEQLVPVIDQVLDSLRRGHIQVTNASEVREVLLVLRSLALQREPGQEPVTPRSHVADK